MDGTFTFSELLDGLLKVSLVNGAIERIFLSDFKWDLPVTDNDFDVHVDSG